MKFCGVISLVAMVFLAAGPFGRAELTLDGRKPTASDADFADLSMEELGSIRVPTVLGASKHEQRTTEAPAAVSIVTQEDIKEYGYRTLGDLLRSVRGFYVTHDRAYNFTGLRGVNRPGDFGGRVLINIDGHRLNEPIYDSAFTQTDFLLDMDLVDRVEVIRGPGSSLYGNNAFFTVINVITREGKDLKGIETAGSVASYDTYSGRLSYGNKFTNGVEMLISGTYWDSSGHGSLYYPEFSTINNGLAEHADYSSAKSTFGSISYKDFKLYGGYIDRRKEIPTGQYGTIFNDPRFRDIDQRGFAELKYEHTFNDDWQVQARAYYDSYRFLGRYPFDYSVPPSGISTLNYDDDRSKFAGSEILVSKTLWERQRITLGSELREDFQLSLLNYDEDPYLVYLDSRRTEFSYAFYAQDEITILTNLLLNAGLRYDHFSTFGGTLNPRGALIYSPWRQGTFKFIYGQAFRAPNAYELDYMTTVFKSNPSIGPEKIRSYELVYEQGLPGNLRASGSLFLNQIKGLIGQNLDPNDGKNFFDNIDEVDAKGFELELEGRWAGGMRTRVSYTYSEAENTATHTILDNSPRHLGKANLVVPLWQEKLFAGLELQTMSSRKTVQGNRVGGFLIANATLFSREIVKNLEVSASIYNLFNTRYRDPVSTDFFQDSIQQDGRNFRVKVAYRF